MIKVIAAANSSPNAENTNCSPVRAVGLGATWLSVAKNQKKDKSVVRIPNTYPETGCQKKLIPFRSAHEAIICRVPNVDQNMNKKQAVKILLYLPND